MKWTRLSMDKLHWPCEFISSPNCIPELKKQTTVFHCTRSDIKWFTRFSFLTKLKRITAYCLRFKTNTLTKESKRYGFLSIEELEKARTTLIRMVQSDEFALERMDLRANKGISKKSKLVTLNPFLDQKGILRVDGRLCHANIEYSRRHPIILPAKHPFTELVIRDSHLRQLHVRPQGILANIRQSYWILSATHLEVVNDLSTTAFLNALKRFIARRGRCAKLVSDNGLNFVGVNNELKALINMIKAENKKIEKFLADQAVQWTFIPPYSPHMGGL
ncbi:uncharacterized protein [Anoplolepis gracilipes]|uniref:uncharacterized protein n=1 Tax=Anoplolepis gracilipes TaxID=354296 RepID=UPI003BA13E17